MNFFNDVLKNIYVPAEFGTYDEGGDLTEAAQDYATEIYVRAERDGYKVRTEYGCSQFVVIVDEKEVYKIPFRGICEGSYEEEDGYEVEDQFCEFQLDHTDKTVELYNDAVIEGVDAVFAETRFVGFSCNNYPIYSQTYASTYLNNDKDHKPSEDSTTKAKAIDSKRYVPFETYWTAFVIDFFGEEFLQKLLQFIDNYGIDDLHRNNYGFTAAGAPIIFDYSGYDPTFA